MHVDDSDFVLSDAELAALAVDLEPNEIGLRPRGVPAPREPYTPAELSELVAALVRPTKVARFHYSIAADSMTRGFLAWTPAGDVVSLTASGPTRRIGLRSGREMTALTESVLGDPDGLRPAPLALDMSTVSVLVWLAVLEHRLEARLAGMLAHYAPERFLRSADVARRLSEATLEDFRWPLMFLAKVLPANLAVAVSGTEIEAGLGELRSLDLLETVDGTDLLEMTERGTWIADEMVAEVSKVAIGVSAFRDDGIVGHDTLFLVRTPRHLLLHEVAGARAAVAAIIGPELDSLLDHTFRPPVEPRFCPHCGAPAGPGFRFCPSCGRPLT